MNRRTIEAIRRVPLWLRRALLVALLVFGVWRVALRTGATSLGANAALEARAEPLTGHYGLFVMIVSSPTHFAERAAARRTWLRHRPANGVRVAHRFFVGRRATPDTDEEAAAADELQRRLESEAHVHGDVVMLNTLDTYNRLPFKTIGAMRWLVAHNARNASVEFALKTDDDSYVRLDRLYEQLSSSGAPQDAYWGFFNYGATKTRVDQSAGRGKQQRAIKWTDPVFNGTHYPPYALGAGYALALPLMSRIVRHYEREYVDRQREPPSRMEDAATGIYVDEAIGSLRRVEVWWRSVPAVKSGSKSTLCQEPMVLRSHVHDLALLDEWWNNFQQCGLLCACGDDAAADAPDWRPETELDYTNAQLRWIGKRKETELQRLRLFVEKSKD